MKRILSLLTIVLLLPTLVGACARQDVDTSGQPKEGAPTEAGAAPAAGGQVTTAQSAEEIAAARGLSPADVTAALKTYLPSGQHDEYVHVRLGRSRRPGPGHRRAVDAPAQDHRRVHARAVAGLGLRREATDGHPRRRRLRPTRSCAGATPTTRPCPRPTATTTASSLFINDKANARVAVIDLRDFETKQIVKNPIANIDHGGTFVTPNTEWVIEGGQYATPLGGEYAPIDEYKEKYRGHVTFWKFDREAGRIDPAQSFAMELPPYWQDLCDAGKLVSDGWVFCNCFNTEMATGKTESDRKASTSSPAPRRTTWTTCTSSTSRRPSRWSSGGQADRGQRLHGPPAGPAIAEGLLYFVPEPKSPHGVDVTPKGDYIVVGRQARPARHDLQLPEDRGRHRRRADGDR